MESIAKPNPRKLFDALPAAIYVTDAEGRLTYFNSEAARLFKGEPELGSDYWWDNWKFYSPNGTSIPRGQWPGTGSFKGQGKQEERKVIAQRPDGTRIWLEAFTSSLRNDEGKTDGRILMLVDTAGKEKDAGDLSGEKSFTDYKKTELANARLGAIVSSSEDAIVSKDLNGIITSWNSAAERMFGYTAEEAIGQSITMLFPEDRIDEEEEILAQLKSGNRIEHYETVRLHKDGTPLTVSLSISPVKDGSGKIVGASKIARDITEYKRAEQALRESEEKYRTLFDSMDEGYCIIELIFDENDNPVDYRFEEVNSAFSQHTGLKDVEGRTASEIIPNAENYWIEIYGKVAKTRESIRVERQASAIDRILEVFTFPFGKPEDGKVAVLFKDITERKRNQQKLKQMNETLEEKVERRTESLRSYQEQLRLLASELSKTKEQERQRLATDLHDNMGQLLAVGKMRLDSLAGKAQSPEVEEEVDELKYLMDQAISYSRKLVTDLKAPPSLNSKKLKESINWIAERMKQHKLEVTVNDDGNPKELDEDVSSTILQCVRELLFNVVKHAKVNRAEVTLSRREGYVAIMVKDEGKGFELEGQKAVSNTKNGFGLFSIKERLKILGGDMDISTKPGEGTRVTIIFPLNANGDEHSEPAKLFKEEGLSTPLIDDTDASKSTIRVLIADDHQMMRDGLRKLIGGEKDMTLVAEASDGKDAVEKAEKHQPDVVVMDVNMPRLNGIDATRKVLANAPGICVIALSFHKEKSVAMAMEKAGASVYLTKSEVFETLCATIRREANGKKTQTEEL